MPNPITVKTGTFVDFTLHKRTLEERLEAIKLDPELEAAEARKAGTKLIRDKLAGVFKITDLANTVFKWNEEKEKSIKALKRDRLFETYLEISDVQHKSVSLLTEFITNPSGSVLFERLFGLPMKVPLTLS
jgi:hypothetical protein